MESPIEKLYNFCPNCRTALARKDIEGRKRPACPECGFVYWNNPKPACSVIIGKNHKVLMLRRGREPLKGYWVLPGGFIEYEEEPRDAAIRETKEETGLDIEITGLVGVYQITNDPRGIHLDIIYSGRILNENPVISDESSVYGFFPAGNLPEPIAYRHKEAIKEWNAAPKKA